ncbi:MAG: hypothetical protein AAGD18_19720 [Actinomycetota bacterium]
MRIQAVQASSSGRFPGVFALVNGLGFAGQLDAHERAWWRSQNRWLEDHFPNPADSSPEVFDRQRHPWTSSWFRAEAHDFIDATRGYLEILDAHGVGWVELGSDGPGPILYEDRYQVVVAARHDPAALPREVWRRRRSAPS